MTAAAEQNPVIPRAAVSAAIFRAGEVLLVQRSKPPYAGLWSLPGGHIETGESAVEAARRELAEETGVSADILGVAGVRDAVHRNDSRDILSHRVIVVFYGVWREGEARPGSDVSGAVWRSPGSLGGLAVTEGLAAAIEEAAKRLDILHPAAKAALTLHGRKG